MVLSEAVKVSRNFPMAIKNMQAVDFTNLAITDRKAIIYMGLKAFNGLRIGAISANCKDS